MTANTYRKGVVLMAPISASTTNPIQGTISSSAGLTPFSLTGTYFLAYSGAIEGKEYRNLLTDFVALLGGLSAHYNPQLSSIRISRATPFKIEVASGTLGAKVLGMTAVSGAFNVFMPGTQFSSTTAPQSVWKSQYAERSRWTRPYEPRAFFVDHEADDGTTYSIGRTSTSKFADWTFEFEPKRKIWRDAEAAGEAYSLERFINDVRADKPFVLLQSSVTASGDFGATKEGIYRLRAEGSFLKPRFKDANYHNHVHFDFKTRILSGGVG